ncbi:mas-related G-protein coupled receptor member A7-like [Gambusia affinis]|uniref:mas-related G-protein coupled receptor member A7-like n=1 Tax=Gambusia affinis TaxID=33528 RepID=UPI001CDC479C|nr:mas-related G-protein coupled receptor member A7-like [Gambusia affinis]
MEKLNFNMSWENSFNYSNKNLNFSDTHYNHSDVSDVDLVDQILMWVNWITLAIGLPLVIIVMIAVFSQVKKDLGAPVYVINLLIADLIQLFCRFLMYLLGESLYGKITAGIVLYSLLVSVEFMMCVSFERYLVIAKPLWYRFRRNIKTYVVVCIVMWILPLLFLVFDVLTPYDNVFSIMITVLLLLAFPVFIFFLVGTIKALSGALSVPADEKRRIAAIQVVVLIIYTLLYLPIIVWVLGFIKKLDSQFYFIFHLVSIVCIFLSPLADTTLYLFIRKSILDKFLASICSCKISNNQETSSTDYESRSATITETV